MPPNIKLHAEKFETLIQRRGRDVAWQEAIMCACWNLDSGQPSYQCKVCGGKGYTYEKAIIGRVVLTSITQNGDYEDMAGMFHIGDAVMTVPKRMWARTAAGGWNMRQYENVPLYNVGMYDLITVLDDDYKTSEVLVKGMPMYMRPADTLLNESVIEIQHVRTVNPATGEQVVYKLGKDFVNDANVIRWKAGGKAPEEGAQYSVVYKHRPVFTVLTALPKPRYQDEQLLPRYVALRYRAGGFEPK